MKFLFSPIGIALIVLILAIVFFPRRAPDAIKRAGKPMRAFDDEPSSASNEAGDGEHAANNDVEDGR